MTKIHPQIAYNIQRSIKMWHYEKHINDLLISITHDFYMAIREKKIQDSQTVHLRVKKNQ